MILLFQTVLTPTETSTKSSFWKKMQNFQVLEKNCEILNFLEKIAKISKFLEKLQFFGMNCRNLKVLASFLLLLI